MSEANLFPMTPESVSGQSRSVSSATRPEQARLNRPVRNQVEMMLRDIDSLLAEGHPARAIWAVLESLDLSAFYASIKAVESVPGRPATDPQVLLALWVYAIAEGIGSARRLDRLCDEHDVYRWLRGGVPVNYHMLSDFRVQHGEAVDTLLSEILAVMMKSGVVSLKRVAQDGMRVRASAGAASFRREPKLKDLLEQAREQVKRLAAERDKPDEQVSRREKAARERSVRERQAIVEQALADLPKVRASKKTDEKRQEARVSTTDPEARVMKMPDGGFRPAFNVQLATDTETQVIVGVRVTNRGSDSGEASSMLATITERTGVKPDEYLVDGGFAQLDEVDKLDAVNVAMYAPTREPRDETRKAAEPRPTDTPAVATWRARMATDEAQTIYRERAATSECVNAQFRERYDLHQFGVRGLAKVTVVATLLAVTHNLLRWITLLAQTFQYRMAHG